MASSYTPCHLVSLLNYQPTNTSTTIPTTSVPALINKHKLLLPGTIA